MSNIAASWPIRSVPPRFRPVVLFKSRRTSAHPAASLEVRNQPIERACTVGELQIDTLTADSNMSQVVLAGVVLLVSTLVAIMVWPISSRSRWNPSGRVCISSLHTTGMPLTKTGLALLCHWGLKWSWPRSSSSSYEARC